MQYNVVTYGENALLVQFRNEISVAVHKQVKALYLRLQAKQFKGVLSLIPAYNSITIFFDSYSIHQQELKEELVLLGSQKIEIQATDASEIVQIPVCYELEYALDMEEVSNTLKMTPTEIVELHTSTEYLVYMLGFAPGFMYLGGLSPKLQIARKATPRLKIPKGGVGLADQQTGVYPLETPGGWQIIGQTPIDLFSKEKSSLVKMGDSIQFVPITSSEFKKMKSACN